MAVWEIKKRDVRDVHRVTNEAHCDRPKDFIKQQAGAGDGS
jgi:hypothetical protein